MSFPSTRNRSIQAEPPSSAPQTTGLNKPQRRPGIEVLQDVDHFKQPGRQVARRGSSFLPAQVQPYACTNSTLTLHPVARA